VPAAGGALKHSLLYPCSLLYEGISEKPSFPALILGAERRHGIASRRISWAAALSHACVPELRCELIGLVLACHHPESVTQFVAHGDVKHLVDRYAEGAEQFRPVVRGSINQNLVQKRLAPSEHAERRTARV
jgi:hypothetical protein